VKENLAQNNRKSPRDNFFLTIINFEVKINKDAITFISKNNDNAFFLKNYMFMFLIINNPQIFSV